MNIDHARLRRVMTERHYGERGAGRTFTAAYLLAHRIMRMPPGPHTFVWPMIHAEIAYHTADTIRELLDHFSVPYRRLSARTIIAKNAIQIVLAVPDRGNWHYLPLGEIVDDFGEFSDWADAARSYAWGEYKERIKSHARSLRVDTDRDLLPPNGRIDLHYPNGPAITARRVPVHSGIEEED